MPDPIPTAPVVKSGFLSTEFWSKNAVQVAAFITMLLTMFGLEVSTEAKEGIIKVLAGIIAVVESAYAISRGIAKKQA